MTGQTAETRSTGADLDPAHAAFLVARLTEEIDAALVRTAAEDPDAGAPSESGADGQGGGQGLAMLVDLRAQLESGARADQMSIDLLTVAYAKHPEFRLDWNRWRR